MKIFNNKWIILILIFLCCVVFSCTSHKKESVKRFIYLKVRTNLISDSIGNPHLSLEEYLEYSINEKIKIATGYTLNNKNPHGLSDFSEYDKKNRLKKILDSTSSVNFYDSIYPMTGEDPFSVFIYQTTKGDKTIIYKDNKLPKELSSLNDYIKYIINLKNLKKIEHFDINNSVIDFEKQLFTRHPPPKIKSIQDIPDPD